MKCYKNSWCNWMTICSALPDCTLDLHNRAGDISIKVMIKSHKILDAIINEKKTRNPVRNSEKLTYYCD